jgi:hypothetical protein
VFWLEVWLQKHFGYEEFAVRVHKSFRAVVPRQATILSTKWIFQPLPRPPPISECRLIVYIGILTGSAAEANDWIAAIRHFLAKDLESAAD